jgi:hypothetical protein
VKFYFHPIGALNLQVFHIFRTTFEWLTVARLRKFSSTMRLC